MGGSLEIRQGFDEETVVVRALSDQRRGAPEAQLLYEETPESITVREARVLQRKLAGQHVISTNRPNKKERRQIHRFREQDS